MTESLPGPTPLVMIPGVQGRWEWMEPAVTALARTRPVVAESLPGDTGSTGTLDPTRGFDTFVDWLDGLFARHELATAAVCGVSYGGLIALRYAARRPARITRLVLASTPSPTWRPSCRVERYLLAPRLMSPIFALTSPLRLYPEIAAAFPELGSRLRFGGRHLCRVSRHRMAPTAMAQRVRLLDGVDFAADCAQIRIPTLVVTGTAGLDRVVDVSSTRDYLTRIAGARGAEITGTGHIGLVTKPDRFAETVGRFLDEVPPPPPRGAELPDANHVPA